VLEELAQRSKVSVVQMPYHPAAHRVISAHTIVSANLKQLDAELAQVSQNVGARVLNLRDPALAGCTGEEFEDSHHTKPSCVRTIARLVSDASV
jgi:hypothetical protein